MERESDPKGGWATSHDNFLDSDRASDVYVYANKKSPTSNLSYDLGFLVSHEAGHGFGLTHRPEKIKILPAMRIGEYDFFHGIAFKNLQDYQNKCIALTLDIKGLEDF